MPRESKQIHQIKVTLDHSHPPVWRRIQVPANTTLSKLHDILQIVMGWENYHLHQFVIDGTPYGNPMDDEFGDLGTLDEAKFRLNRLIRHEGQRFNYEYDFGDGWEHSLLMEEILSPQQGMRYPVCVEGKRACPPEDVGGVWGYERMLEAIGDPDHEEHEEYLDWLGGEFDPGAFDLEEVNAQLRSMGRGRSADASSGWPKANDELAARNLEMACLWSQTLPAEQQSVAEELPLRRDMVTLLTYLRDNKVTGTQSTGNLTLKAVREISTRFVDPPPLETVLGAQTFRVRSESELWPLYFRHVLAAVGGLVTGGPSRRWKLTPPGESYLAAPALVQVWHLLATWWTQTNWAIASPYGFESGALPPQFAKLALEHLLAISLGKQAAFSQFADLLIGDSGMLLAIQDQGSARTILHGIVERAVINPLIDFGILRTAYEPHAILGAEFRSLSTFQVTPFGKSLLETILGATRQGQP